MHRKVVQVNPVIHFTVETKAVTRIRADTVRFGSYLKSRPCELTLGNSVATQMRTARQRQYTGEQRQVHLRFEAF